MSNINFMKHPKGSIWRKWDLHVHTPKSILNNGFGNNFDAYVKTLFKKAIEKRISVIGITDYFSIDGYQIIKENYLENQTKMKELFSDDEIACIKEILILPNIEFRLNKLVGTNRINFHIVFSNNVSITDIKDNFLEEIDFVYEGNPQNVDEKRKLKLNNLIEFGRKLKSEHEDFRSDEDLFVGMKCAVVDDTQIFDILNEKKSIFKNQYLVGIPSDDDLSEISWNSSDHNVRKVLIQKSNFIFSSNANTREWALGRKSSSIDAYINEFKTLKPCVWGSDCHDFEKLFEPDLNRYTWIKGDPTFEGLKQIIYEPDFRVRIQELEPEIKENYHIIDKVRFVGSSEKKLFSEEWIELNPYLNSIIGGKSSGKSILLHYIAKTIDRKRIDEINEKNGEKSKKYSYSFEEDDNFGFEVQWKGGVVFKLSDNDESRRITYIPQLYLNDLAEERKNELNDVVDKILSLSEDSDYNDTKKLIISDISKTTRDLNTAIDVYFENHNKLLLLENELKELDDKNSIEESIKIKEEQIEKLKTESNFTDEDLEKYSSLSNEKTCLQEESIKIETYISNYTNLSNLIIDLDKNKIPKTIEYEFEELLFGNDTFEKVNLLFKEKLLKKASSIFQPELNIIKEHIAKLENRKEKNASKLESHNAELVPFEGKIEKQSEYKSLTSALNKEKAGLKIILDKEREIESQKVKIKDDIIFEKYKNLFEHFIKWKDLITKYSDIYPESDLRLVGNINFNISDFENKFSNMISKKSPLKNQFPDKFDEDNFFIFDKNNHCKKIEEIFKTIMKSESFKLNQGFKKINVIKALFDNYFSLDFDLKQGDDFLLDMSPGKRGIILFQLYLQLSYCNTPILIDQPEDNLDNRTVYQELNDFIKQKKINRQIIIISHNPNLVVSTDSENIIVANQKGQNRDSKNETYQFEYVSGAIENTFLEQDNEFILQKMGIREHICHVLEGGKQAFEKREQKYGF